MNRVFGSIAVGVTCLLALAACGGGSGDPLQEGSAEKGSVVVGSANFPENILLGEIYAQALEDEGVNVTRKFNIGAREVLYGQIKKGGLTVLPEYNGALDAYVNPKTEATTTDEVNADLEKHLAPSLKLLNSSEAEDKDSITVTEETAQKHDLESISDLKPVARQFIIGGPPEFKTRHQGLLGLQREYGLRFKQFKSLDVGGPITVAALKKGQVQVANLFTTDPNIEVNDFVVLDDPKQLFSAQNVTPLVYKKDVTPTVTRALNEVSAKLTTDDLLGLMDRYVIEKEEQGTIAKDWLRSEGLVQ